MPCRLCEGPTSHKFPLILLRDVEAELRECADCGSLQTIPPTWLDRAYDYPGCAHPIDTGYMTRNIHVAGRVDWLLTTLGVSRDTQVLDWGGGIGILARILRERGWNVFSDDKYVPPAFEDVRWQGGSPGVILAVELFEHLPDPALGLAELFAVGADVIYVSTL